MRSRSGATPTPSPKGWLWSVLWLAGVGTLVTLVADTWAAVARDTELARTDDVRLAEAGHCLAGLYLHFGLGRPVPPRVP